MKYAFVGGYVLNGNEDMKPEAGLAVLVDDETITAVVPEEEADLKGYKKIDLKGKYLMPGLINMHVHLPAAGGVPKEKSKPTNYKALFRLLSIPGVKTGYQMVQNGNIKKELYSGCTTIRTVGGLLDFDTRARDKINKGKLEGPRILAANTGISVPGGHFAGSLAIEATSPEGAREYVRKCVAERVDLIKLMITGGVMDASEEGEPGALRMQQDMVTAACDEAHKNGLPVAAHVESPEGVKVALRGGVDTIEHGAQPDEEMINLFKETGSAHICTISPAVPYTLFDLDVSHCGELGLKNGRIVFEGIIECAKACLENDIPVGLGTDTGCPFIRDYDMWRELQYFHLWCGVSNAFALYTATKKNAEIAHIDDVTGTVEAGKYADLLIVEGNPLEDLKVLRKPDLVVTRGRVIDKPKYKIDEYIEEQLDKYIDFTPEDYEAMKAAEAAAK